MSVQTLLEVKNGDTLGALRGLLRTMMERDLVDAVWVPLEAPGGKAFMPALVKDLRQLDAANPLAPVMRVHSAPQVAALSTEPGLGRIGVVMRPCEVRAFVELAKLQPVALDRVTVIGLDCLGTYETTHYGDLVDARSSSTWATDDVLHWAAKGELAPYRFRTACQVCEHPAAAPLRDGRDMAIGFIGLDARQHLLVMCNHETARRLGLSLGDAPKRREVIERVVAARHRRRERILAEAWAQWANPAGLLALLSTCSACFDCLMACPLYTRDGRIRVSSVDPLRDRVVRWSKGSPRVDNVLSDALLAEIIPFGRLAACCVGCGMCESACPQGRPLGALACAVGEKVQERLGYRPGRSLDDPLPWKVPVETTAPFAKAA